MKSFILFQEYKEHFELLTDEQAGKLIKAIFLYNENIEIELEPIIKMAFSFIKMNLDRNKEKYDSVVKRNKNNGLKGGRPITQNNPEKPKITQNNPVGFSITQNNLNNKNKNNNDNKNNNKNNNLDFSFFTENEIFIIKEWVNYRIEKKKPLTQTALNLLKKDIEKNGLEYLKKQIENSIKNGYQGLFEVRENKINSHLQIQNDSSY